MLSGRLSAARGACTGSRASMRTCSPPSTLSLGRSGRPSTATDPASIQERRRAREYWGSACARAWSKRSPAASGASVRAWERNSSGAALVRGAAGEFAILTRFRRRAATERPFLMFPSLPARGAVLALCAVLLLAVSVSGCHRRDKANLKETPAQLYKKAHKAMVNYDFNSAIKTYERLTARFPSPTRRARRASTSSTHTTAPARASPPPMPPTASSARTPPTRAATMPST